MMHDFLYQDYEFRDYPSAQPLPAMRTRRGAIQEQEWLTWQGHPIAEAIRTLETEYVKYPGVRRHAMGSGRTHPQPEPKTVSFRRISVQQSKGTA